MKFFFLLFFLSFPLTCQILSNVTAYWKLDEGAPSTFTTQATYSDASGRGHTLTVNPNQRVQPSTIDFRIGANSAGGQALDGSVAQWGKWNRLLTAPEKAALIGGEKWPFSTTTSLQDAVVYFLLDEASNSATYADATGRGNTLTRSGTTTQVAGPGGTGHATQFTLGSFLHVAPTADLNAGNYNLTVFGWFNMTTKPGGGGNDQSIFWGQSDINSTPRAAGLAVYFEGTGNSVNFDLDNGIDLFANGVTIIASSPTTGTWYPVLSEFNATTSQQSLTFNGTTSTFLRNIQPGAVAAKINNGARFSAAPSFVPGTTNGWDAVPTSRATAVNSPDLTFGNNSKTTWLWFRSANTSPVQSLAGFYDASNSHLDWLIQIASGNVFFHTGNNAGTFQSISVPFTDTTAFHLVVCWYDKAANTIHLNLDHGASSASLVPSFTPAAATSPLFIGSSQNGIQAPGVDGASLQFLGVIDEMGIANGAATSADLDTLWNGGAGITFPSSSSFSGQIRGQADIRGNAAIR